MGNVLPQCRWLLFTVAIVVLALTAGESLAGDLSGAWSGQWDSVTTGHTGPLRATFCRISDSQYQVDFHGRFFKVFPFHYSVVLNAVDEGDTVRLSGDSYLGRMFGWFHYNAVVVGDCFTASYSSCKDSGEFRLTRCCGDGK
jgi:hypothetical protein